MRRCLRTESPRHRLRFPVIQIWIAQVLVFSPILHFFEGIAQIGRIELIDTNCFRRIGLDCGHRNSARTIGGVELRNPGFLHLRNRAVVAGEDDHQHRTRGIVAQPVVLPSIPGNSKIRRGRTQRENGMSFLRPGAERQQQN
jgi:hypothetical protein